MRLPMLLIGLLLATTHHLYAQAAARAAFSADRGAPLIGEPIRLTLTVEVPAEAEVILPDFPLDWPPFMVTSVGEVQITAAAARTTYQQELVVILWQPGDYQTPETFVEYRMPDSPESVRFSVERAFFVVPSVLNPDDLILRPLKSPESLPYVSPLFIAAGFAVVMAVIVGVGRWIRKRRLFLPVTEAASDTTTRTLHELQRIGAMALPPFRAYPMVGDTLRRYVEEQFDIPAEEMTTEELLSMLQSAPHFNEKRRRELRHILERVDLVKFAQYQPETDSTKRLLQAVTRWVEEVAPEKQEVEL